jgi:hypothetical protein
MTDTHDENVAPHEVASLVLGSAEVLASDDGATSLRGPAPASIGRRTWLVVGAIGLTIFAALVVVSFLSASNDNARIERMKNHGIPVAITVTNCFGNIGGSGSNGAGYTCHGRYKVGDVTYGETIGSLSTFVSSGTVVRGVADPSHHGSVVLAVVVKRSIASASAYVDPGLLTAALLFLTGAFLYLVRRSDPSRRSS